MARPPSSFPRGGWGKGTFPDPYAGKPVPAWPKPQRTEAGSEPQTPPPAEPPGPPSSLTPKPGQLILVGCSQMFAEQIAPMAGHMAFFRTAVHPLPSGASLIGIGNKQQPPPPFAPPSPAKRAWLRFLTLGLMPVVLVAASLLHAAWRKRLREAALFL